MSGWIFEDSGVDRLASIGLNAPDNINHTQRIVNQFPEYLLNDSGQISLISDAHGGSGSLGGGGGGAATGSPASTLVGSGAGLMINLIWDASVQGAANWSAVENAVVSAAQIYTSHFSTHALLNIEVGLGEVAGSALGAGDLGESETLAYGVDYATLAKTLAAADAGLVSKGLMAAGAVTAVNALAGSTMFVASAEAKALGLISPVSTALDGYIGLANSSELAFAGTIAANQYDAVGVAAHEISEVMGRLGIEGGTSGSYSTALDLFRYSAAHQPALTPGAGYFSTNLGVTALNAFNNPANGGDAADWATSSAPTDAYNAFGAPGVKMQVTATDLLAVAALGYHPSGALTTVTA
jgi:hypothetical protein